MKRFLTMGLVCAALVCFCALPALNAADAPADGLKMANTKKPVTFNHSTHKGEDCKVCHHTWDGAAPIKKCSDAGCHDKFDKKDKSKNSYYQAIHSKKASKPTCVSCHKDVAGADKDKKKLLTGCNKSACHP
ncbi:cytochrome c3 family protein [Desulfocurvus sp. DL9XJH121]